MSEFNYSQTDPNSEHKTLQQHHQIKENLAMNSQNSLTLENYIPCKLIGNGRFRDLITLQFADVMDSQNIECFGDFSDQVYRIPSHYRE